MLHGDSAFFRLHVESLWQSLSSTISLSLRSLCFSSSSSLLAFLLSSIQELETLSVALDGVMMFGC